MRAITPDLEANLKAKLQAGPDGFRGRLEVDQAGGSISLVQHAQGAPGSTSLASPPAEGSLLVAGVVGIASSVGSPVDITGDAGWTVVGAAGSGGAFLAAPVTLLAKVAGAGQTAGPFGVSPAGCVRLFVAEFSAANGWASAADQVAEFADVARPDSNPVQASYSVTPTPAQSVLALMLFYDLNSEQMAAAAPTQDAEEWQSPTATQASGLVWRELVPADGAAAALTAQWAGFAFASSQNAVLATWQAAPPLSHRAKSISIDKSLRMPADQATVELANEGVALGWGPSSLFPTNSRCRVYQWYGDPANEVKTFTGVIDQVQDRRDLLGVTLTLRDMMAALLDDGFSATAPQGADEDGAVRTAANGVYLSMEASDIVDDILDRAGWPTADRAVTPTSYTLDEYVLADGWSWAEAIIGDDRLTGLTGYSAWADEDGVFHFAPTALEGSLTDPGTTAYTFRTGEDIVSLDDATDQYELRTRVKVRGPMTTTTLTDTWREVWRTSKIRYPVGVWYDPGDSTRLRVLDRGTKRIYNIRQSDRQVMSYVSVGGAIPYPLGLSGDPSDATVYWVLNGPWLWGSGAASSVKKVRRSDNVVLATYTLDTDHWSAVKVSGSYIYLTNLTDDRVYRRSKTDGTAVDSFRHTYASVLQSNPSGIMVDGTTLYTFWANSGTTARFLKSAEAAPGTVTGVVTTAGTVLHGGEMDTTTHTDCYGDSDTLGLTAKFTLLEATSQTADVYAEVVDTALEDELGTLAQLGARTHDTHSGDAAHPFEVRRETVTLDAVVSLAQATETAARRLDALSRRHRVLDAGIVGNPALQKTDLVRVEDPVAGIAADFIIDTYRSQMDASSGTYLGTLALIPVDVPDDAPADDGSAS